MGTNYYWHGNVCAHCGRGDDRIHIGKSSGGWCFGLHVTDEIKSLDDWRRIFWSGDGVIRDECGQEISNHDMMNIIMERAWERSPEETFAAIKNVRAFRDNYKSLEHFYEVNDAVPGPNNLLRHRVDGGHCIGNGDGTWDLITGEFS